VRCPADHYGHSERKEKSEARVYPNLAPEMFYKLVAVTRAAVFTSAAGIPAAALFARLGDVDGQSTAVNLLAVERADGRLCFIGRAHGDETETARTTTGAISHQIGFEHGPMGRKRVLKIILGGVEGNISNEQFIITHICDVLLRQTLCSKLFPTFGFRIITELSSPEDLPDLETDKLSNERLHGRLNSELKQNNSSNLLR